MAAVFRCHLALRIKFRAVYTLPAVQEGTLARCCSIKRQRPHDTICYSFRTHTLCASKEVLRFVLAKTTGPLHERASFYRWNTRWVVLRDRVVVCLRCGIVCGVCLQLFSEATGWVGYRGPHVIEESQRILVAPLPYHA